MRKRTIYLLISGLFLMAIFLKCYQYEEDYYCAKCTDKNSKRLDQMFCGKEQHCKDFIEYVIQSTVAIDSVMWECTIE